MRINSQVAAAEIGFLDVYVNLWVYLTRFIYVLFLYLPVKHLIYQ